MYPGDALATIVMVLEDVFTLFFSTEKLHAFSVHDFVQFLSRGRASSQRTYCENCGRLHVYKVFEQEQGSSKGAPEAFKVEGQVESAAIPLLLLV